MTKADYHKVVTREGFIYHLLGNGLIQSVVQVNEDKNCYNAIVLHLMDPDKFDRFEKGKIWRFKGEGQRKYNTFLYHNELGPEPSAILLKIKDDYFLPHPSQVFDKTMQYGLELDEIPYFKVVYPARYTISGERKETPFIIQEKIFIPIGYRLVFREVTVTNFTGTEPESVTIIGRIVPNQTFFYLPEYNGKEKVILIKGEKKGIREYLGFTGLPSSKACKIIKNTQRIEVNISYPRKINPQESVKITFVYFYDENKNKIIETARNFVRQRS